MQTPEEFWNQAIADLLEQMSDVTFEVVTLPGDKPHAHAVDRPDIEIIPVDSDPQTGRNYDAWQRPLQDDDNPIADPTQVAYDVTPSPVMLSMNLDETDMWLRGQLLVDALGNARTPSPPTPPDPPVPPEDPPAG
jgi:hypothetical protein